MTIEQALAFKEAIISLRKNITDQQALEAIHIYPSWKTGKTYEKNERIVYNNVLYTVLISHVSQSDWTPESAPSLFAKVLIPSDDIIYDWEQPDSTNPYSKGDKVKHNGKIWLSTVDGNVWEPGVYGWEEVNN